MEERAHVGLLSLEIFIPASNSLKTKRRILQSVKDRIRVEYRVSVAETGELDKWQKAIVSVCTVSNDQKIVNGCLENIASFVNRNPDIQILSHRIEML